MPLKRSANPPTQLFLASSHEMRSANRISTLPYPTLIARAQMVQLVSVSSVTDCVFKRGRFIVLPFRFTCLLATLAAILETLPIFRVVSSSDLMYSDFRTFSKN